MGVLEPDVLQERALGAIGLLAVLLLALELALDVFCASPDSFLLLAFVDHFLSLFSLGD